MSVYGEVEAFQKLHDKRFDFYGVDRNFFKIGSQVWEAVEDEDDGYRSYLGSIKRSKEGKIFSRTPYAKVRVVMFDDSSSNGFRLIDTKDGHIWLTVGTNNTDDYYPWFMFEYCPKEPSSAK